MNTPAKRSIEILDDSEIFHRGPFRWRNIRFNFTKFDGTVQGPIERLVLDRGDSVGMVLHDLPRDEIILVEQLRAASVGHGSGWLLEIPAGMIDQGEDPKAAALRETKEETGTKPHSAELIATFYLSPGACSERMQLFYCPFPEGISTQDFGGLASEGEDIRIHRVSVDRALAMVQEGEIQDAKTILAIYWLKFRSKTA